MKKIKKVAVSPIPRNEASVIDSFNTTDDKTINAPSINAVEGQLNTKVSNTNNNSVTLRVGTTSDQFVIVRKGDVVSIKATAIISSNSTKEIKVDLPTWAFPDDTAELGITFGGYISNYKVRYHLGIYDTSVNPRSYEAVIQYDKSEITVSGEDTYISLAETYIAKN